LNGFNITGSGTPYCSGYSYCVSVQGSNIIAVNGSTQNVDFSGTNTVLGTGKPAIFDAMNQTEANGGGVVYLRSGTYNGNYALNWTYRNTKLKGEHRNSTWWKNTGANNIEIRTNNVRVDVESIYFTSTGNGDNVGIGVYSVLDDSSGLYGNRTFDLYLKDVKLYTLTNAIFIANDPTNTTYGGLGNISIKDSLFFRNSQNTDGTEYPGSQYDVVSITGFKNKYNELVIDNNRFIMDGIRRDDAKSLSITGDAVNGHGQESTSLDTGTVSNNYFDNSTRECFQISDARTSKYMITHVTTPYELGSFLQDCNRSIVTNNIVNYSFYRGTELMRVMRIHGWEIKHFIRD